jgi:hypothetical protein
MSELSRRLNRNFARYPIRHEQLSRAATNPILNRPMTAAQGWASLIAYAVIVALIFVIVGMLT